MHNLHKQPLHLAKTLTLPPLLPEIQETREKQSSRLQHRRRDDVFHLDSSRCTNTSYPCTQLPTGSSQMHDARLQALPYQFNHGLLSGY